MSVKLGLFAAVLGNPLNKHNFEIFVPQLEEEYPGLGILVRSTTFPADELGQFTLHYLGEPIRYPSIGTHKTGDWSCDMPESEMAIVFNSFVLSRLSIYNQFTGLQFSPAEFNKFDVLVTSRDLNDLPVFSVILHGTYIKSRDTMTVTNDKNDENMVWKLGFSFDWLEDIIERPIP